MLRRFGLDKAHPTDTPLKEAPLKEDASFENAPKDDDFHSQYRQAIGCLMYLMIGTRPDLAYAVQALSRHLNNPGKSHWESSKRVMRYVAGTLNYGLIYTGTSLTLTAYSDSVYASDPTTRRSITGYCTFVGGNLAEYIALAQATREVLFQRTLHEQCLNQQREATVLFGDNQPAIAVASNPVHHARTKHIDVRYHFIRERIQLGDVKLKYVSSKDNVADIFTKPLPHLEFQHLRDMLGVLPIQQDSNCTE
ncbi:hypothetical protein Ae201684P_003829 [Aphanomyces euteiches]|nr:hypothetical protein Ae201684P_003829 [Aphanomyces euteiches]